MHKGGFSNAGDAKLNRAMFNHHKNETILFRKEVSLLMTKAVLVKA